MKGKAVAYAVGCAASVGSSKKRQPGRPKKTIPRSNVSEKGGHRVRRDVTIDVSSSREKEGGQSIKSSLLSEPGKKTVTAQAAEQNHAFYRARGKNRTGKKIRSHRTSGEESTTIHRFLVQLKRNYYGEKERLIEPKGKKNRRPRRANHSKGHHYVEKKTTWK